MSDNKIKRSIDKIEISENSKNDMYENILSKANVKKRKNKELLNFSKGVLAFSMCCCLVFVVYLSNKDKTPIIQAVSPIVEVDSAEVFEQIGLSIDVTTEANDITYSIINGEIACIDFIFDGNSFNVKSSKSNEDILDFEEEITQSNIIDSSNNAQLRLVIKDNSNYYEVIWSKDSIYYKLTSDSNVTDKQITYVYENVIIK